MAAALTGRQAIEVAGDNSGSYMDASQEEHSRAIDRLEKAARPPRKRRRIVISCTECHRRKQKCDRLVPCSNCIARGKQHSCHYENQSTITKRQSNEETTNGSSEDGSNSPATLLSHSMRPADSTTQLGALGYTSSNGHNSLGILKKIESHDGGGQTFDANPILNPGQNNQREKYKSLVRQLPSKILVDRLILDFFTEINYIYSSVDEDIFMELLAQWNNLPFTTLNQGPQILGSDLRFFPALLFQVLALSLQFQPPGYDPALDSLKYAAEMTLDDLASDYSDSGAAILALLGKQDTSLVTVQAGFLRTSCLKNNGMVIESWHSLGQTIRDAQELGMDKDRLNHTPRTPEDALQAAWHIELRRRVYMTLRNWDGHMAIVLGRPTSCDSQDDSPSFPLDARVTHNRRLSPPLPRSEIDAPTPLTALLWNCRMIKPFRDILALEKEGAHPKDYGFVERVHQDILKIVDDLPPFLRYDNPDNTFDSRPDCRWLPAQRITIRTQHAFGIMALHRPYCFTIAKSQKEVLKAGLDVLQAQRKLFQLMQVRHYKMFSLVFSTFDALVVMAAIYIMHPTEHEEHLKTALQHFDWSMERFEVMSSRNNMAKAALRVLKAIYARLTNSLWKSSVVPSGAASILASISTTGASEYNSKNSTPEISTKDTDSIQLSLDDVRRNQRVPAYTCESTFSDTSSNSNAINSRRMDNLSALSSSNQASVSIPTSVSDWDPPAAFLLSENFNFNAMAPLQPMHDLVYNDLGAIDSDPVGPNTQSQGQGFYNAAGMWQFEGDFRDDSFWNFMNQYNF